MFCFEMMIASRERRMDRENVDDPHDKLRLILGIVKVVRNPFRETNERWHKYNGRGRVSNEYRIAANYT